MTRIDIVLCTQQQQQQQQQLQLQQQQSVCLFACLFVCLRRNTTDC